MEGLSREEITKHAMRVAKYSHCTKRQVGCVIALHNGKYTTDGIPTQYKVLAIGFNHNPNGGPCEIGVCEVTQKLITSPDVVHAEVHAINAYIKAKEAYGWEYSDDELEVFVTYQPCEDCATYAKARNFNNITVLTEEEMNNVTEPAKDDIHGVLAQRGSSYGEFENHAEIAQHLKQIMYNTPGWKKLPWIMREALEMVMHKVARILNGDPMYDDSWIDIIGYVQLVINWIKKQTK